MQRHSAVLAYQPPRNGGGLRGLVHAQQADGRLDLRWVFVVLAVAKLLRLIHCFYTSKLDYIRYSEPSIQ